MDPYSVLGVPRDAPVAEIRRAYVTLARATHPDLRGDDPRAAERMRRINLAWETLSDAGARAALDRSLQPRAQPNNDGHSPANPGRPAPAGFGSLDDADDGDDDLLVGREAFGDDDFFVGREAFEVGDEAITGGDLPAVMRLGAPAAFAFGILAISFGLLVGGFVLVRLGLASLVLSVVLFVLSPFVVLIRSRGSGPQLR